MLVKNWFLDVLGFFKIFGIFPYQIVKKRFILQKSSLFAILIFVIIYWTALLETLINNEADTDKLSTISNSIQALIKGASLTVILISPLIPQNVKAMNDINFSFTDLDARIGDIGYQLKSEKMKLVTIFNISSFCLFLIYMGGLEIYVYLVRYDLFNLFYWIITFLPTVVQTAALCFAISLLTSFYYRLKLMKKILKNDQLPLAKKKFIPVIPEVEKKLFLVTATRKETEDSLMSRIVGIFPIFNDLLDLGCSIERFFGPMFLSSIASIFVITTIQIYYCYVVIASNNKEHLGFSYWSLVVSINEVFANVATLIYLTTLCEMITNEVRSGANDN